VETSAEEAFVRGKKFFDIVYTGISDQTMNVLNWCGTPDLGAIARMGYGFFLSHTDILSAGESMIVTTSGCIAMDVSVFALPCPLKSAAILAMNITIRFGRRLKLNRSKESLAVTWEERSIMVSQ
jgi:hypothetical protein